MKKFIAALTCLILFSTILPFSLSAVGVLIDAANFPDPVFREYVKKFDLNNTGSLAEKELTAVTEISINEISSKAATSLIGIKNFRQLKMLNCCGSNLSELDLSGMTKLQNVCVYQNNLETLNLSGCSALNGLNCQQNQLTQIDLTGCSSLGMILCNHNQLTELDVSNCPLLETLSIYENHIAAIDVSRNNKLVYFTVVPQKILMPMDRENNKWTVDLGALVGKSNLGKVAVDAGLFNAATGLLTFDAEPTDFNYTYKAGGVYGIDVHVTLYRGGLPVITANNFSFDPRNYTFDPLREPGLNLNAFDTEDGNLTAFVKAEVKTVATWGSASSKAVVAYNTIPMVDTKKPGLYIISYTVTDRDRNTATLDVYITVRYDSSMTSMQSGPASILPPNPNTAFGPTVSNEPKIESKEVIIPTSDQEDIPTPPMGAQDTGTTIILALMLTSASAALIITKHRNKAK